MKGKNSLKALAALAALSCSAILVACANQGQEGTTVTIQEPLVVETAQTAETPQAAEKGDETKATAAGEEQQAAQAPLYTETPRTLAPVECGSCHGSQYVNLQKSNSKHRFECTECHTELHAYSPAKNNYAEIMPKCTNCHDLPHGEAFPNCSQCHQNPHSPLNIPFSGVSQKIKDKAGKGVVACQVCHYETEGEEMATFPNKHNTEVGCTGCHADKHGVRPTCFDCHEPHVTGQVYADCLVCHRPHSAKNILAYPEETPNNVCGSCHTQIFENLQTNHTKHSELHCATCHDIHGKIPKCQNCHGEPHGATVHKRFPNCIECHVDPHNLPVNKTS